ncbi:MAG: hypothetical protein EGQ74_15955 [Bacteroides nordii]|uniref:Uncharacterized protein n=1 Tax=Bacteroides nordii TaxID=291645 RepID=A0A413VU11_9BACE|nr:hypothetical protein [Bacteroides nordii]OKZ04703.1 MAG: hypothetical protein BHV71_10030 [Bacteroides sp. 41_26]RHB37126.1 hypothetical protein DW888_06165 [Bacteroides nordii]
MKSLYLINQKFNDDYSSEDRQKTIELYEFSNNKYMIYCLFLKLLLAISRNFNNQAAIFHLYQMA